MANRLKEDEKNERIIRNLLKLPENRRCINCNSLGPQYVCTNFSTFVCTTCGGIHREFTHRVKSVSLAKFTPQEVSALQGGGNASAREIYLKEWDPQRNSLHDGSNVEKLRDFIKHVYVDRRYTGERNLEKPLRAKMAETDDFNGNRRTDAYQGGSRSPPYDDSFECRHSDRPSPGGRSPGYDEGSRQNSNYRRSPARAEVVNDWRREDRFGNGRRTEGRSSDGGSRLEGGSPDNQRDLDMSSPPVVRPVRDILGENASPLRVIEPPKATGGKSTDGSAHTQRTASSSSMASPDGNPTEVKAEPSFIDFDSAPEPPAAVSVGKQVSTDASSALVTKSASNDWANFDSVPQVKAYTTSSNSVASVLSELSIPASMSGSAAPVGNFPTSQSSGSQGLSFDLSFGSTAPTSVLPPGGGPTASLGPPPPPPQLANAPTLTGGQWPSVNPQQHSLVQGGIGQPVPQVITPVIGGSVSNMAPNQLMPNFHRPPTGQADASVAKVGEAEKISAIGTAAGSAIESSLEAKSRGREALPEALFTMNYSYAPPVSGWYSGSPYVTGFPMQYNMPMAVSNFQMVPRSTNPFDVGNEPLPVQASAFPSVAALQEALPKTATASGLLRTSSLGTPPPHPPSVLTQVPSYASAIPPSSFLGQDVARGMAPRPLGPSGYSLETPVFAPVNPNHQLTGLHPAHSTTNNFSSASGNPFG